MKKVIRINYIFWKEGPLLPGLLTFPKICDDTSSTAT